MNTQNPSPTPELIVRRHYNKKELRFLLGGMSLYHLNRMIDNVPSVGLPLGRLFSPRQIADLIHFYGLEKTFLSNQQKFK